MCTLSCEYESGRTLPYAPMPRYGRCCTQSPDAHTSASRVHSEWAHMIGLEVGPLLGLWWEFLSKPVRNIYEPGTYLYALLQYLSVETRGHMSTHRVCRRHQAFIVLALMKVARGGFPLRYTVAQGVLTPFHVTYRCLRKQGPPRCEAIYRDMMFMPQNTGRNAYPYISLYIAAVVVVGRHRYWAAQRCFPALADIRFDKCVQTHGYVRACRIHAQWHRFDLLAHLRPLLKRIRICDMVLVRLFR